MTEFKITDAMKRMLQARQRIARRNPFFAGLLFNAKLVETDQYTSIVNDGINVYFNPEYVTNKANNEFIEGDFLKVIMLCALLHMPRKSWRELKKWNQSTTLSVGPLVHQYFKQHPFLMKDDARFGNKAAEEIYEELEDQEGGSGGGGSGSERGDSGAGGRAPTAET